MLGERFSRILRQHILEYCRSQGWLLNSQMHRRSPWLFGQMKIMNNLCIWMWMHSVGYVGMYVWGLDMACQKCSTAVSINGSQRQFCAVEFGSWKVVYASSFGFFSAIDQMVILTPCSFCNSLSYPPFPHIVGGDKVAPPSGPAPGPTHRCHGIYQDSS